MTRNPAAKRPTAMICWRKGRWRDHTVGMGRRTVIRSVKVFMQPAARRWRGSEMQFSWGPMWRVQYWETGLDMWSIFEVRE